jgi:putative ABC transport system permease protein
VSSFLFLLRFSFLSLIRHRWVFLLTLLGVSTGTAVVSAVLLANKSALLSFQNAVSHVQGKTDYSIRSPAGVLFSDRVLDRLERLSPAPPLALSPLLSRTVRYGGSVFWIRGVDFLASADHFSPGGSFDALTRGGAYLPPGGLSRLHLRPGDRMRVLYGTRMIDVTILGELPRSESVSLIPSNTLFMDLSWVQMLFGLPGKISRIDLTWQSPPPPPALEAFWVAKVRSALAPSLTLVSEHEKHKEFSRLLFSYRSNLFALSLVSLIVGMFLIYNTLSLLTLQGRKMFSTLRLLGVTPREVQAIVLLEGGIIGLSGGLLGIVGGHFLSRLTIGAVARTLDTLYLPVGILPHFRTSSEDLEIWALTVLASLFSSYFPAREALRLPPVFSQHRTTLDQTRTSRRGKNLLTGILAFLTGLVFLRLPPYHGFPLFGYLGALLWVFSASLSVPAVVGQISRGIQKIRHLSERDSAPGMLALSHFRSGVSRSQIAISSVMIGLSMMTGIVILVHSFELTLNLWISRNLVADLYVKPLSCQEAVCRERLDPADVRAIRNLPGVDFLARYTSFPALYRGHAVWEGFTELEQLSRKAPLSLKTSHPQTVLQDFFQGKGVLVSESFAYHFAKRPGDVLTLPSAHGPVRRKVLAIYRDYSSEQGIVLFPWKDLSALFGTNRATNVSIFLKSPGQSDSVLLSVLHDLPGHPRLFVRSQPQLKKRVLRIFHQSFAITYALLGISLVVSVIGVGNTLLMLLVERTDEFRLMRAMGFSTADVRRMLLLEALWMSLTGTLMGLVLGTGVGWIIVHVINRQAFGWTILWSWPAKTILLLAFALMVVATLSSLLPSLILGRKNGIDRGTFHE